LLFGFVGYAGAIDVSVSSDRWAYGLDDSIEIVVTAYNPGKEAVWLGFDSNIQSSYWIDDVYDWEEGRKRLWVATGFTLEPQESHRWEFTHYIGKGSEYPLTVGRHYLKGEVLGYGISAPVEIEVVPEPAGLAVLGMGAFLVRRRRSS
jgi:hypothetical protein